MRRQAGGMLIVLVLTTAISAQEKPAALDPKLTFTDAAAAGAPFDLQGEYAGWVLTGNQEWQPIGLQVIALGGGAFEAVEYGGGLPGAGATGKGRLRIRGERQGSAAVFRTGPLTITVADGRAVFYLQTYSGTIATLEKVLRVSPTQGAPPPPGAIVLFDGSSTEHFEKGRKTDDGLLIEGTQLKRSFGNYSLHLEFRLPLMPNARGQGRANSGVYLQSRYEVQILDSFGLAGKDNECGGLYHYRAPRVNMCLPPLSWQTYDIDFDAATFDAGGKKTANARLTVRHNGVLIHHDFPVERKTGAGRPEGPEVLPTKLQNHGNPIRFRNIWIVDRSRTGFTTQARSGGRTGD